MLEDWDKFGSWLFTITKRLSIDWVRKGRVPLNPLTDAYNIPNSVSVEEAAEIEERKAILKKELFEMAQETLSSQKVGKDFEQKVIKRITGVACINIPVRNIEKSVDFYVIHLDVH